MFYTPPKENKMVFYFSGGAGNSAFGLIEVEFSQRNLQQGFAWKRFFCLWGILREADACWFTGMIGSLLVRNEDFWRILVMLGLLLFLDVICGKCSLICFNLHVVEKLLRWKNESFRYVHRHGEVLVCWILS